MSGNANNYRKPGSDDLNLTALALGQLDDQERTAIEQQLADANGESRQMVEQTRRLADEVRAALNEANPSASESLRKTVLHRLGDEKEEAKPQIAEKRQSFWRRHAAELVAVSLGLLLIAALLVPAGSIFTSRARHTQVANNLRQSDGRGRWNEQQDGVAAPPFDAAGERGQQGFGNVSSGSFADSTSRVPSSKEEADRMMRDAMKSMAQMQKSQQAAPRSSPSGAMSPADHFGSSAPQGTTTVQLPTFRNQSADQSGGGMHGGGQATPFNSAVPRDWGYRADGQQRQHAMSGQGQGIAPNVNYQTYQRLGGRRDGLPNGADYGAGAGVDPRAYGATPGMMGGAMPGGMMSGYGPGSEQYAPIVENAFIQVQGLDALSTFSIDVDTASYANVRRFLSQGQLPPANAVRIEELVNYFRYDYSQPKAGEPFSMNLETAECPWQPNHLLLRVGLKGREIHHQERPVSNLVFLLDVSGSMADQNKLPLLKQVLSMMVRELREDDRVSIVTYAGEAGLRLPPTTGDQQERILQAIDSLQSGGSTNGSAGIELAYDQARSYFRPEGTNRVILATDGDLNVGITDDESLVRLIKEKAAGGTFLTVLGFGEGNLKDAKMERLADNGNGLYAYIDSVREGRKVLIEQMSGSLVTIAKDVKIQIEFNPAQVQAYRLIGYENRMLTAPEFADDRRDAGEIGAGHTVTALYELVPTGMPAAGPGSGEAPRLRYQTGVRSQQPGDSGELLTVYLRYKEPDGMVSKLSEHPLASRGGKFNAASRDFQFAAAVASFGMQLRNSQYRGQSNLAAVAEIASASIGEDKGGYRAEFVDLVRKAQGLRPVGGGPVNTDY